MRYFTLLLILFALFSVAAAADTVTLTADRDATLIEDPDGARANGSGPLFAGRTAQSEGSRRRAVLRFNLEGAIPKHAIVDSVELALVAGRSNPGGLVTLHRLQADWAEGPTFSGGGGGRPSQAGDATWLHTSYLLSYWVRPGGHYVARPSASAVVKSPGLHTWSNHRHMLEDVRLWQHNPSRNFGWIVIGDETRPQSAIILSSREHPDPDHRPQLTIRYRLPGRR